MVCVCPLRLLVFTVVVLLQASRITHATGNDLTKDVAKKSSLHLNEGTPQRKFFCNGTICTILKTPLLISEHSTQSNKTDSCNDTTLCIRKCCSNGSIFDAEKDSCVQDALTVSVWNPANFVKDRKDVDPKKLQVIYGQPPKCEHNHHFHKDTYSLLEDGRMHLQRHNFSLSTSSYCVENVKTTNGTLREGHIFCLTDHPDERITCKMETTYTILRLVSSFFLILTLVVYAGVPKLREKPYGRCLISLVTANLMVYIVRITNEFLSHLIPHFQCIAIEFFGHMNVQALFFWINVMGFELWRTVQYKHLSQSTFQQHSRKKFIIYSLYAWGCPLLLSSLTIYTDFTPSLENLLHLQPVSQCNTAGTFMRWVLFTLWMINLCIFIHVCYKIQKAKKSSHFWLFLKIFLITTILGFLNSFKSSRCDEYRVIAYAFVLLQGFFIFFLTVCNKFVIKKIIEWWKTCRKIRICSSSSTATDNSCHNLGNNHIGTDDNQPIDVCEQEDNNARPLDDIKQLFDRDKYLKNWRRHGPSERSDSETSKLKESSSDDKHHNSLNILDTDSDQNVKKKLRVKLQIAQNKMKDIKLDTKEQLSKVAMYLPLVIAIVTLGTTIFDVYTDVTSSIRICQSDCTCIWQMKKDYCHPFYEHEDDCKYVGGFFGKDQGVRITYSCTWPADTACASANVNINGTRYKGRSYCQDVEQNMKYVFTPKNDSMISKKNFCSQKEWQPIGKYRHPWWCSTSIISLVFSSILNNAFLMFRFCKYFGKYCQILGFNCLTKTAKRKYAVMAVIALLCCTQLLTYTWYLLLIYSAYLRSQGNEKQEKLEFTNAAFKMLFTVLEDIPQLFLQSTFFYRALKGLEEGLDDAKSATVIIGILLSCTSAAWNSKFFIKEKPKRLAAAFVTTLTLFSRVSVIIGNPLGLKFALYILIPVVMIYELTNFHTAEMSYKFTKQLVLKDVDSPDDAPEGPPTAQRSINYKLLNYTWRCIDGALFDGMSLRGLFVSIMYLLFCFFIVSELEGGILYIYQLYSITVNIVCLLL